MNIFRDMKPENVLIGRSERIKENVLHVVDFGLYFGLCTGFDFEHWAGLAKPYIDTETRKHIAYAERRSIIGIFCQDY